MTVLYDTLICKYDCNFKKLISSNFHFQLAVNLEKRSINYNRIKIFIIFVYHTFPFVVSMMSNVFRANWRQRQFG